MSTNSPPINAARPMPAELADVALLDIKDVCAAVRMSASWVHDEVREGRFPQPMRFGMRCTRWQASAIRQWLEERAERARADGCLSAKLVERATRASLMASTPEARAKSVATRKARAAGGVVVAAPVVNAPAVSATDAQNDSRKDEAGRAATAEAWKQAQAAHAAHKAAARGR